MGNNGGQADEEIQRSSAWAERHGGGSSVCGGAESRLCSFSDVGSYSSAITVPARVILSHPFAYSEGLRNRAKTSVRQQILNSV